MLNITYAGPGDKAFWLTVDRHMRESEFDLKVREKRCYIISYGSAPVGVMRYNLFWDSVPFLTLIYLAEAYRGKGLGKAALLHWENEMRSLEHKLVLTSTQADEQAQHFYRKLGYKDAGCLTLDTQALEIIMTKKL